MKNKSRNNQKKKPLVIAIAAVSGGGKTPIAKKLTDRLTEAIVLHFDEYKTEGPSDFGKRDKTRPIIMSGTSRHLYATLKEL
ncbi:zeta toxin family protein [Shouchella patagoniensis]|uniref:zeta toxin family protein n=1 Tax=Shouchella patagoniensis TaxID=228576 RepID=UPI001FE6C22F|nr:zeta toxin family protein [Shouchella patagoniensis]